MATPHDLPADELNKMIKETERQMKQAAELYEFEKAAGLRDRLKELREIEILKRGGDKKLAWQE